MVQVFIEAKREDTPEGVFLRTLIQEFVPDSFPFVVNAVNGWSNLCEPANVMLMQTNSQEGGKNLVIFDADSQENGGGHALRLKTLKEKLAAYDLQAEIFLWPDNQSDGTVESLMLDVARKDLHAEFFDCYGDYEACLRGVKDADGSLTYHCPDLKAKAFAYISSMKLSNNHRKHLGRGDWQFDNPDYWDLGSEKLEAIKAFLLEQLGK